MQIQYIENACCIYLYIFIVLVEDDTTHITDKLYWIKS